MLTAVLLTFLIGLVIVFPPAVRLARAVTRRQRVLAARWSGIAIDEPYRPEPPPPVPQADGWYRDGRTLYRKPTIPAFNKRWNWMTKDPATWRDLAFLLSAASVAVSWSPHRCSRSRTASRGRPEATRRWAWSGSCSR